MTEMGVELIVMAFAVVVIGGLGSMKGAFFGAMVVGILRSIAISTYPELELLLIYLIVIGVLVFKPEGLFGGSQGLIRKHRHQAVAESRRRDNLWSVNDALFFDQENQNVGLHCHGAVLTYPCRAWAVSTSVYLMLSFFGYGVALLGLNLLFGYTGLLSFGHAMFFAMGAYTVAFLTGKFSIPYMEINLAGRHDRLWPSWQR